MSTRIRLSRTGSKNRPFFKIVVTDKRNPRDGKFIEKLGTYNPLLSKDDANRVIFDEERVKYWLSKGATPSYKMAIFLSKANIVEKPPIPKQTKKHLPKEKKKEGNKQEPAKQSGTKPEVKAEDKPQTEVSTSEAKIEDKPQTEALKPKEKHEKKAKEEPTKNKD
jgi:small subunit ribosomal protein S16